MDTKEKLHFYDGVIGLLTSQMWKEGKENSTISLCEFDRKNENHLCILHIALIANYFSHFPIEINTTLLDYIWLKLHKQYHNIKYLKKNIYFNTINCNDFTKNVDISSGNKNLLAEIYNTYYKEKS